MTSSAWRWKRRAANGWSSTIPRTTRAKAPRARQAGGGGDERPGRATATAPTWEKSPKGDATDAPSTYNRQTTGIQRNYNGNTTELQPSSTRAVGWFLARSALSSRLGQGQPSGMTREFSRVRTDVVGSTPVRANLREANRGSAEAALVTRQSENYFSVFFSAFVFSAFFAWGPPNFTVVALSFPSSVA